MRLPATPDGYREAARRIAAGGLVALPTETVYGLAGDARKGDAIRAIYALKGRPASNPLIVHVASLGMAGDYGVMNRHAEALAGWGWPGPLTLVVERRASDLADGAGAGLATIALRCPDVAWRRYIDGPLVMPSANLSGHVSPTRAEHVMADFPELAVVDAGSCRGGIESTVVRVTERGATVLRPGGVTETEIARIVPVVEGERVGSPGLLLKHYAPAKPVRLEATEARAGEWLVGFGEVAGDATLSARGDVEEAARNLYALLRAGDAAGAEAIAVAPVPEVGVGVAVNDRLRRAARGR